MLNLATMLTDTARRLSGRTAVIEGARSLTYGEINDAANKVGNLLRDLGVRPGDRVALTIPNIAEFPIVYFGILKSGAIAVPLNTMLKRDEVAYHLRDSGAKVYFCSTGDADSDSWRGFEDVDSCTHLVTLDAVEAPMPRSLSLSATLATGRGDDLFARTNADDTAVILYTSGTTGKPKGVELTHVNIMLNALTHNQALDMRPDDVHLVTLPLFHSFAQTVQMNAGFAAGLTLVLLPRFDAATALDLIVRHQVSVFCGVPTMYWSLLSEVRANNNRVDLSSALRLAASGAAPMPVEVLNRFREVFGVGIHEGYGLTETSPTVTFNPIDRPNRPGSIGMPLWGIEVKLVDVGWNEVPAGEAGELAVRGPNVMKGYFGRPAETAEVMRDGWFRTGDIATRDDAGYYYIVDRAKDMIVRAGFNVYPREVEELMMTHPDVSLVAVVGVPDARVGEDVKAFVVRHPGSNLSEAELIEWCRERLAVYKCPRAVEFRESLPMNAAGKLAKQQLKAADAASAARAPSTVG